MNLSKCPHCFVKLGNFQYADACPQCHRELEHNTRILEPARTAKLQGQRAWPIRLFFGIVRLVES